MHFTFLMSLLKFFFVKNGIVLVLVLKYCISKLGSWADRVSSAQLMIISDNESGKVSGKKNVLNYDKVVGDYKERMKAFC